MKINYRPISILPSISKIFEKVIYNQLYTYFVENNYFSKTQYGFRKLHYTEFAILEITKPNNYRSETAKLSIGVPQGTILGPLLFLIYINDIQQSSNFFNFIKYADDTALLFPINHELNNIYNWLCLNKLSLNINKTKFMIFHTLH